MSHQSPEIVMQIDLKKKKLENEIHQLEKELRKQQKHKKTEEIDKCSQKSMNKNVVQHSKSPGLNKSTHKDSNNKPAISENWKNLFQLQPQLYRENITGCFNKDDYRQQVEIIHSVGCFKDYFSTTLDEQLNQMK